MKKLAFRQMALPTLEPDGVTHTRECECARCEAGFRTTEAQRRAAAAFWEEKERLRKAQEALDRRRERRRVKALVLQVELAEEAKRTAESLRAQEERRAELAADPRLEALLRSRRAGKSVAEALAEVEHHFGEKGPRAA